MATQQRGNTGAECEMGDHLQWGQTVGCPNPTWPGPSILFQLTTIPAPEFAYRAAVYGQVYPAVYGFSTVA